MSLFESFGPLWLVILRCSTLPWACIAAFLPSLSPLSRFSSLSPPNPNPPYSLLTLPPPPPLSLPPPPSDGLLDFVSGDRDTFIGPANKATLESTNPTLTAYDMPYIYDSFAWDHCEDEDYEGLFSGA